jgi:hypothetical protein
MRPRTWILLFVTILVLLPGLIIGIRLTPKSNSVSSGEILGGNSGGGGGTTNPEDDNHRWEIQPNPTIPPKVQAEELFSDLQNTEEVIRLAFEKLPKGDLYHNVPSKMKVQKQSIIEAGITPKINAQILKGLQGEGSPKVTQGVTYSPAGVEMRLITRKEDFDIIPLHMQDKQKILRDISGSGRWKWLVTPLNSGRKVITIQALAYIKNPKSKEAESIPYEVYSDTVVVEANPGHSISQFIGTNWKELLGLIFGSGSVAGGLGWYLGQRKKKVEAEEQEKEPVAGKK